MLNRLPWLQRCMPKPSQLQLLDRRRGLLSAEPFPAVGSSPAQPRGVTTSGSQRKADSEELSEIRDVRQDDLPGIVFEKLAASSLEAYNDEEITPTANPTINRPTHLARKKRNGKSREDVGIAVAMLPYARGRQKNTSFKGSLSGTFSKPHVGRLAWTRQSVKTRQKDGNEAKPFSLGSSDIPEIGEGDKTDYVILNARYRESILCRNGTRLELERFVPRWNVSSGKLRRRYKDPKAARLGGLKWESVRRTWNRTGRVFHVWRRLPSRQRSRHWIPVLLHALRWSILDAIPISKEIMKQRSAAMPAYIAQDCVEHICTSLLQPFPSGMGTRSAEPLPKNITRCFEIAGVYLSEYSRRLGTAPLSERSAALLIRHLDLTRLSTLEALMSRNPSDVTPATIRKFAYRYTREHEIDKALRWVGTLPQHELDNEETLMLCTTILRKNFVGENLYRVRTSILSFMLEIGVKPNRHMHNVVLLNAMEAGDRATAWSSHRIILENGVPTGAFAYSILLKGILYGDGLDSVTSICHEAKKDGILHRSPALAFSLVHSLYYLEKRKEYGTPFQSMLKMYSGLFDLTPLQDIGIALDAEQRLPPELEPMRPPVQALGCMVIAWLEENYNATNLDEVYSRYIRQLSQTSSRITITAHYRYIFNAFILAFGKRGGSLTMSASIVQAMQDSYKVSDFHLYVLGEDEKTIATAAEKSAEEPAQSFYFRIPKPDVMTWSILLDAFVRNKNVRAAEGILKTMQSYGQTPNEYTWNHLINGYASLQDIPGVVETIQQREGAGLDPDTWTLKALGHIRDRDALLKALSKATKEAVSSQTDRSFDEVGREGDADGGGVSPQYLVASDFEDMMAGEQTHK